MINKPIFLTIIVPIFNCEQYLSDCLESILDQDLDSSEYEILCINDGSTDQSAAILQEYSRNYPNIVVFTQENKGVSVARNVGLDNAKGDYVMFVDGDDIIRRNILNTLKNLIRKSKCNRLTFGGFCGTTEMIDQFNETVPAPNYSKPYLLWLNAFCREIIEKNHIRFIEGITHSEDVLFLNDFINFCKESVVFPETVYYYRSHTGSTQNRSNLNNLQRLCQSHLRIALLCKKRMNQSEYDKQLNYNFWKGNMSSIFRYTAELPYPERLNLLTAVKSEKPYLIVQKNDRQSMKSTLYRSIILSSINWRIKVAFYANPCGGHLLYYRRKLLESKLCRIIKHPKRFIKQLLSK